MFLAYVCMYSLCNLQLLSGLHPNHNQFPVPDFLYGTVDTFVPFSCLLQGGIFIHILRQDTEIPMCQVILKETWKEGWNLKTSMTNIITLWCLPPLPPLTPGGLG